MPLYIIAALRSDVTWTHDSIPHGFHMRLTSPFWVFLASHRLRFWGCYLSYMVYDIDLACYRAYSESLPG